jgi:hypothetical protein
VRGVKGRDEPEAGLPGLFGLDFQLGRAPPTRGLPLLVVKGRARPAFHPTDEDLSVGTPAFHPTDEDLSVGTPAFHPTDEDLSAGTPAFHPTDEDLSAGTPGSPRKGRSAAGRAERSDFFQACLPEKGRPELNFFAR